MALVFGSNSGEVINPDDGVTDFDDEIYGLGGNDEIYGYGGNDILLGGSGFDYLDGGDGTDTVYYDDSDVAVAVDLVAGSTGGTANGDTYFSIERIHGSHHSDFLKGDDLINEIKGDLGNDHILGVGGNDDLYGEDGNDHLEGGLDFDDLYGGSGDDLLEGGDGGDWLVGELGADSLYGGNGIDLADYSGFRIPSVGIEAITIDLQANTGLGGHAQGDTFFGIENLKGTVFADTLSGDGFANSLGGEGQNDQLFGRTGNDLLFGGEGDDLLDGGEGADFINGEAGYDTVTYADSGSAVVVQLALPGSGGSGSGGIAEGDELVFVEHIIGSSFGDMIAALAGAIVAPTLDGAGGDDVLTGGGTGDILRGGKGSDTASYASFTQAVEINLRTGTALGGNADGDTFESIENLIGTIARDRLSGNGGENQLDGDVGNDVLFGGKRSDYLLGSGGRDKLSGDNGNDKLSGGAGGDRFYFRDASFGVDTILDFQDNKDLIDLRGSGLTPGSFSKSQSGADVVLTLIADMTQKIILKDFAAALIGSGDFIT